MVVMKEDRIFGTPSLILRPENGGILSLIRLLLFGSVGSSFLEFQHTTSTEKDELFGGDDDGRIGHEPSRIVCFISIIFRKILGFFRLPIKYIGRIIEYVINFISLNYRKNENIVSLILRLLLGGKDVVKPERDTVTFISAVGHIDGRSNLYTSKSTPFGSNLNIADRALIDLSIMSAKLAYENRKVVQGEVENNWNMHFVDFYDCWNDFQKKHNTHVFIYCNKKTDANLIVISFRGTDPFSADNWSSDVDYTLYKKRIHMGFLEAMGLGNRKNTDTITKSLISLKKQKGTSTNKNKPTLASAPHMAENTAYVKVRDKLRELLDEHKNAKFLVTGHSLGGALAIVFPVLLLVSDEHEIMDRLLCIHTYGQPRIGNDQLRNYVNEKLVKPDELKYLRFVYCNDVVPRLPYDDHSFYYKHCGTCIYYDSNFKEEMVGDEPDPNFRGMQNLITKYLNAWYELLRSFRMGKMYGPDYEESWLSIVTRIFGLFFPGLSAHCPINYVNSVRLGTGPDIRDQP